MEENQPASKDPTDAESDPPNPPAKPSEVREGRKIKLRSLAPEYKEEQHASYVFHLQDAVKDPRNRNIALTGRYGSGKSSILDSFIEVQENPRTSEKAKTPQGWKELHAHEDPKKVLRVSINTLGLDDDADLTNRIQKELVKQLVYRAAPGEISSFRFARKKNLTKWTALRDALIPSVVLCGLLWLFGVRPEAEASGGSQPVLSLIAFVILVVTAFWAIRWTIGNRSISQFSTGGTSISLDKAPDSYFDAYLDEIVIFFDETETELVVFEDLDRFDDPQIFDSLRELNTLINSSAHWKQREDRPLRFIYAIKDSLFERLGEDLPVRSSGAEHVERTKGPYDNALVGPPRSGRPDVAITAVERANRTKFFEVVIPVVPFLSHSNARDLLSRELERLKLPVNDRISRELLDLVARHATDMRLLVNICNEFIVFAERLLRIKTPAPGMTADHLFALVVYKNFHLSDFEALPHRASALDALELKRKHLVRTSIQQLHLKRRNLHLVNEQQEEQAATASVLSKRLQAFISLQPGTLQRIEVGEETESVESAVEAQFWKRVAEESSLSMVFKGVDQYNRARNHTVSVDGARLAAIFPECPGPDRWSEPEPAALARQRARIDDDVADLRGADFDDLAKARRFTIEDKTFDDHVDRILKSELARDLVRRGFINRYYAEYSATFYGAFLGVDVANFFRNTVWPNEINIDFRFTTDGAVSNVLHQAPAGFTSSRSCLNIDVVEYLLQHRTGLAEEVTTFLVAQQDGEARVFLEAYLNSGSPERTTLVALLAGHPWRRLLDYLAEQHSVSDEKTRIALYDAALLNATRAESFDLGEDARALLSERHTSLGAFTEEHGLVRAEVVFAFIQRMRLRVPSLRPLSSSLFQLVVEGGAYALTSDNIRAALRLDEDAPITLDFIVQDNSVWNRCRNDIGTYFESVERDCATKHAVQSSDTLSAVISEQHDEWSNDEIGILLNLSAPHASLPDINAVPKDLWPMIAAARRVVPSAGNLYAYATEHGVDADLATVLVIAEGAPVELEGLEDAGSDLIHDLMVRILNASQVLEPETRVSLALQLDPEPQPGSLEAIEIEPAGDGLLAKLLEAGLLPDTFETFERFVTAGWNSVSRAFEVSENAPSFLTPELLTGHARELLHNPAVPTKTKSQVVNNLDAFVADTEQGALREAAKFAFDKGIQLPAEQVERVAPHASEPDHVLWQLEKNKILTGEEVMRLLGSMGSGYEGFQGESGHKFDVPHSPLATTVLNRLRTERLVELPRGGKRKKVIVA